MSDLQGWKRTSVIRHTTVHLPFTLSSIGNETLTVMVLCDSVKGLELKTSFHMNVSGDEELVHVRSSRHGREIDDFVDDLLDAGEFDDEDMVYDEYLIN